jgi:hypothetical protein
MLAYLGIAEDGSFELCVSAYTLNVAGSRLEKGKAFPEAVRAQLENRKDPMIAIAGLRGLANFLSGTEHGVSRPEFGVPVTRRRSVRKNG